MDGIFFPVLGGGTRTSWNFGQDRGDHTHKGVDIATPVGTSIIAPIDMTVLRTGYQKGGAGNYIVTRDSMGYEHKFFHLSDIGVSQGQTINAGDIFAASGNTGRSTGPHLHYEVYDSAGRVINPKGYLSGSTIIDKGKQILGTAKDKAVDAAKKGVDVFLRTNPATAGAMAAADAAKMAGIDINPFDGEGCGTFDFVCKLKKWITESSFFQRLGLALLALIIIGGGLMLLGKGVATKQISEIVKGA